LNSKIPKPLPIRLNYIYLLTLIIKQYNPVLVKMSCDNLRFLSCLSSLIFQREIQYAINIINVDFVDTFLFELEYDNVERKRHVYLKQMLISIGHSVRANMTWYLIVLFYTYKLSSMLKLPKI
jgi:hypothetical protein